MQKTLSIYFDNPILKDAKKTYKDIVNKRITTTASTGSGNSLWYMDASTIRPSGVSKFTLTDAPRLTGNGTNTSRIPKPKFASTTIKPGWGAKGNYSTKK